MPACAVSSACSIRHGEHVLAPIADANLRYENKNAFGGGTVQWSQRWNRAARTHHGYTRQPHHHFVFLDDLTRGMHREWQRLCDFLQRDATTTLGASCNQPIAGLRHEPWKRDAVSGLPGGHAQVQWPVRRTAGGTLEISEGRPHIQR